MIMEYALIVGHKPCDRHLVLSKDGMHIRQMLKAAYIERDIQRVLEDLSRKTWKGPKVDDVFVSFQYHEKHLELRIDVSCIAQAVQMLALVSMSATMKAPLLVDIGIRHPLEDMLEFT